MPFQIRWALPVLILILGSVSCSKTPETPLHLARHLHRNAEWAAAIEQCDLHLLQSPDDVEVLRLRGQSHYALGNLNEALSDFSRAVELNPKDPEPLYLRSLVYRDLGQDELAMADRNRALRYDPTHDAAYQHSPANFSRPIELDLSAKPNEVAEDDGPTVDESPNSNDVEDSYAADELDTNDNESPDGVQSDADEYAASPNPPESGTSDLPGPTPFAVPGSGVAAVPGEGTGDGSPEAGSPRSNDVPEEPRSRPRYQRTPQVVSTALPPVMPSPSLAPSVTPSAPLETTPRTTGIQSSRDATASAAAPQQLFGIPLLPVPGLPNPATVQAPRAQAGPLKAPFVPAPTGRPFSRGSRSQTSTALPTQLAPQSPYSMLPNPIPGQTQTPLSTSIRPVGPTAQPKPSLSTARPQGSGS